MPLILPTSFPTTDPDYYVSKQTGFRPVVFDVVGPDMETSILPQNLKLVLHVNPKSMSISYSKMVNRIQTKGGFVEQHFGEGTQTISFDIASGGFMRVFTGMSAITGGGSYNAGGTRRETLAYDKYLDLLALYEQNGAVYGLNGQIVLHGVIKVTFDGTTWFGWFQSFSVSEEAEQPYQFTISADFVVSYEIMGLRSVVDNTTALLSREGMTTVSPPAAVEATSPVGEETRAGEDPSFGASDGSNEAVNVNTEGAEGAADIQLGEGTANKSDGSGYSFSGSPVFVEGGEDLIEDEYGNQRNEAGTIRITAEGRFVSTPADAAEFDLTLDSEGNVTDPEGSIVVFSDGRPGPAFLADEGG